MGLLDSNRITSDDPRHMGIASIVVKELIGSSFLSAPHYANKKKKSAATTICMFV